MSGLDDCELTTYGEMADVLSNLRFLTREVRRARRLSMRGAATEMGIPASVLHRMEQGSTPSLSNVVSILEWLEWQTPAAAGDLEGNGSHGHLLDRRHYVDTSVAATGDH
jgi:hypothetical protein